VIPRILVAGVGNILLQDDGLGPQTVARLQAEYAFDDEVELLDIGTPTLDFVDYLRERDVLILIDALSGGGEPGEILTFDQERLKQVLPGMRLSAHQPCLNETMHAAQMAGIEFEEALLIGVVGRDFNVTTELGPVVAEALPQVMEMVAETVRRHGVFAERRAEPLASQSWWQMRPMAVELS
jgi:hydrogenase maturation protease